MGIGDELMAAGEARARARVEGEHKRYLMLSAKGCPKWHYIWNGNPNVAAGEPHDGVIEYVNGHRPYIVGESPERRWFREYRPEPAFVALPDSARRLAEHARGAVVFNPTVKFRAPVVKQWGVERWKELVRRNPQIRWLQVGESGGPRIRGAESVVTATFFDALGLLSGARAAVVHEGALHHGAAAVGVPAVVIRGGFISPKVTGYAGQADLYVEDELYPLGCGMRIACMHCDRAMASITPEQVMQALDGLLEQRRAA